MEIINSTITILHIVNITEIQEILDQMNENAGKLNLYRRAALQGEIQTIKSKINTIIPISHRKKRGLINAGGKLYKWLFGTMDDEDRQEILEHLSISDQNSHHAINTLNKQIFINDALNKSLHFLKIGVENDRNDIKEYFMNAKSSNSEIAKELLYFDQLTKLKNLEHKIDQIQDNIVSAKHNIVHPGILTTQEVLDFEIDFYKLKMLKVGIISSDGQSIIVAVQLPDRFIKADLKIIIPISNANKVEIESENEYIVEVDSKALTYEENIPLRKLKISKHCTFNNNCKFIFNNDTSVSELDDETIIIKNAFSDILKQTCDDRNLNLTGNFLVTFNNCSITFRNQTFLNKKFVINEKYVYPNSNKFDIPNVNPKFHNILIKHFENIEQIKELKFHKKVSYGINITLIIVVIIISIILYYIFKGNNIKINIKENPTNKNQRVDNTAQINLDNIIRKYNR